MTRIFHSLFWRIAILFFAIFVLVGILYVYIFLFTAEMYVQETDQRMNRQLAVHTASRIDSLIDPVVRTEDVNNLFFTLEDLHPGVEPYLVDSMGQIVITTLPHAPVSHVVNLTPVTEYLHGDGMDLYLGDDPCGLTEEKVFSAAPVRRADSSLFGYLYIVLHGQEYESLTARLFDSYILTLGSRSLAITLGAAIAISLVILAFLLSRLRRLTVAVREFGSGNYDTRAPGRSSDEIGELAGTFNTMASTIEQSIAELKTADTNRREFFANISHDLKTPLTSIRGFVETLLLKWSGLPADLREQYLQTILNRTGRLSDMVSQILELSRLEARETSLSIESMDLKDMLSDLLLEFNQRSESKGVTLSSEVTNDVPNLQGDIGLIERALRNLLDNAIRHTPSGGTVNIRLASSDKDIQITVEDSGEGISADHLPHVFDRFYRADKSRSGPTANTGLGLPITKQIVEMHHGSIDVASVPGEGTTFSLRLPISGPSDE